MKQFSTFFLIFLLIASCAKKRTAVVKGRVLNPVTGEGISNAKITMYHSKLTSYDNDIKVDAQTFSASDGSFEISSKGFKAYELACVLDGDYYYLNWFEGGEYKSSFQPLEGKTQDVDFHAIPYGELKYSINNTSCFDSTDSLILIRRHQIPNFYYTESTNKSIYLGCFHYNGSIYSQLPMGWHYFEGYHLKNNIKTLFRDSIYITANGFHEWIFNY